MMDAPETEPVPQKGFTGLAAAIGARNLIIVIITMPLAFVAVVAASLALFGKPGDETKSSKVVRSVASESVLVQPPQSVTPPAAVSAAPSGPLILSAREDIAAMALDGDRLALRLKGPSGGSIVIYDLASGAEIKRIRVIENPVSEGGL